ncbi:MAG: Ig-like domain-containing protein [Betaproteobacteria bacterium]|nr:Ig-like domain-containing protein [Betaproteobacteria bacterium]
MKSFLRVAACAAATFGWIALGGCGGGGGGGASPAPATLAKIVLTPASVTVAPGTSTQLTAAVTDATGATITVPSLTWVSASPTIATVDATGKVSGVSAGSAQITASSSGVVSNAVSVTVSAPIVALALSPPNASVTVGGTAQFTATAKDGGGNAVTGLSTVWASSNPSVASIDAAGKLTGLAVGSTNVTAAAGGVTSAPVPVTVNAVVTIASVTVSPTSLSLSVGANAALSAVVKDTGGNTVASAPVTWQSSNTAVATVDSTGRVTAVAVGSAQVTAMSGSISSSPVPVAVNQTQSFIYYKRHSTLTPQTATLTNGTLSIDGLTITGVYTVGGLGGTTCLAGGTGTALTACYSPPYLPQTMLLCGPDPVTSAPNTLLYVLFNSPDAQNVASNATNLLNALQSGTQYLGIGVYTDCSGSAHTSWIRNYPNTNYYLWPDVFTTYSSAYVSGLLNGAVITSTPTAGSNFNNYVVVRSSASVFEVWH